ncbi:MULTISPECIES: GTP cyclohydrolase I FolE [unclassified Psychrobacter]|uniref:GTP cyclohydrolase I FolE n=1 Tax=unclassified Psychrobacter TaxID=196806 RepID=UPI0018F4F2AA|nr:MULTISPECIES: GTP cyclohydrolase I FolE [unclassified Psychrobacter]
MSNTPTIASDYQQSVESYRQLIESTGEDLERPGLLDTPERAAKAFGYLTQGYHQNLSDVVNDAVFPSTNRELVLVQNIEFYSLCEHHMLPFHGVAHIGYLPNGQVLGLSKFARIVDMYARRLQIQENLSEQIAQTIMDITGCRGVAVVMDAAHMCMMMRGVNKQHSTTRSTAMLGEFVHDVQARNEFLGAVPKRQPSF